MKKDIWVNSIILVIFSSSSPESFVRTLLRKVGNKTGIDVFSALKNSGFTLGRQVVAILVAITLNILYSRLLSKDTFGEFSLILAILGVASIVTLPSLNSAIIKAVAKGNEGFYSYALRFSFLGGIFACGIVIILSYSHFSLFTHVDQRSLIVAALLMPLYFGCNGWESFQIGRSNFYRSSLFGSLQTVGAAVVTAGVLLFAPSLFWLVLAFLGSVSLFNLFFTILTWRQANKQKGNVRELLWLGANLSWINFLPNISQYLEKLIIGVFLGPAQLALFVIASLLPDGIKNIFTAVLGTFTPRIAANSVSVTLSLLSKNRLVLLGVGVVAAVFSIIVAPFIMPIAFGSQYQEAIILTQYLSVILCIQPLNNVLHTVALFDGKVILNTIITTLPTLVRFILYPFVLPHYGLEGYIFLLFLSEVVFLVMTFVLLKRQAA